MDSKVPNFKRTVVISRNHQVTSDRRSNRCNRSPMRSMVVQRPLDRSPSAYFASLDQTDLSASIQVPYADRLVPRSRNGVYAVCRDCHGGDRAIMSYQSSDSVGFRSFKSIAIVVQHGCNRGGD